MSAECSTCGHDLAADYPCAYCVLRERAEKAERERGDLILAGRMVEAKLEDALRERDDYQRAFEETQDITISQADEIVDLRRERDELAAALDDYSLWEPGRAGHAEAHRKLFAVLARHRERTG